MIEIVPFRAEHVFALDLQDGQAGASAFTSIEALRPLESTLARTAMHVGEPVACAGIHEVGPDRGFAWTYLSRDLGRLMVPVHRAVSAHLSSAPFTRVEMAVDVGFEAGHRWALMLGFTLEAPIMRAFYPGGRDCSLYAKVRGAA